MGRGAKTVAELSLPRQVLQCGSFPVNSLGSADTSAKFGTVVWLVWREAEVLSEEV
jgi:hypothetical protein